jgi:hypothetical protein
MDVATLVTTLVIAVVGLYLTHSLRRQQSLKIEEQRLGAYRPIWELMEITSQSRGSLTRDEAQKLRTDMVSCYYRSGKGMFLTKATTELYWAVRSRLGQYVRGEDNEGRAKRCMKDFSLLRQQMRLDLQTLSGRPSYWTKLREEDKDLLRLAGIRNPENWGLPWYRRLLRSR